MKKGEEFFEMVWQVVKLIPKGRATSYGAIAKYLGAAKSARVVGWAMNASHTSLKQVPAHRVVNRNGVLSGKNFFSTPFAMQEKLELDGLKIVDDKIIDFKSIYWDPQLELTI